MSLEQDVRFLSQLPLFAQLEPEALRLIAFTAEKLSLAKDETLFRRGEASDCSYVVLSGKLLCETGMEGEASQIIIHSPALIGELALIIATQRPGDVSEMETASVMKIPRALFLRVIREFPIGAEKLRSFLAGKLGAFSSELDEARNKAHLRAT